MWSSPANPKASHHPETTFVLLDAGNTEIKWCVLNAHDLSAWRANQRHGVANLEGWMIHRASSHTHEEQTALCLALQEPKVEVLMCSVLNKLPSWMPLPKQAKQLKCTQSQIVTTLKTQYQNPSLWGPDRLAQVLAVHVRCMDATVPDPQCAHVVFGFGTATTWDILIPDQIHPMQIHLGGGIAPGFGSALQCMHSQTSRLPMPAHQVPQSTLSYANNTENGMILGALHAQLGLVHSVLRTVVQEHPHVNIYLCGGYATDISALLMPQLPNNISASVIPHAVLQGLCAAWNLSLADGMMSNPP